MQVGGPMSMVLLVLDLLALLHHLAHPGFRLLLRPVVVLLQIVITEWLVQVIHPLLFLEDMIDKDRPGLDEETITEVVTLVVDVVVIIDPDTFIRTIPSKIHLGVDICESARFSLIRNGCFDHFSLSLLSA